MSIGASVRGAAAWSMATQYAAFAIQFVASVLIARLFLGPSEVGLFSIALSAAMLVSILQDFGITRYLVGEADLDDGKIERAFSVSILFALAVALVIAALAWPVARFYDDMRLLPLLLVIAGSYLLVPFGIVPVALLQRALDFRELFAVQVGSVLAGASLGLALAAAGFSAMALAWGTVVQAGVRAALGMALAGHRPGWPLRMRDTGAILRFGSGASLLYLSGGIGGRTPELIIGRILDFAAVGLYGRAVGLAGQLRMLVGGAVGQVFYPAFRRIRDAGDPLAPPYLRVVAAYSATTWPAMVFLAVSAVPLVLLLFGERWAAVAPLLVWIALGEIPFTALPLHMDIPILMGRMRTLLWLNIADTVASVGFVLLGALWSLEGAAASRVAYGIVWLAIYARFMHGLVGFRWRDMLRIHAQSLAASVATAVPLLLVMTQIEPATIGFVTLAACAVAGVVAWAAAMFAVRHPFRLELLAMLASVRATT